MTDESERSSKEGGWLVPVGEEPFEHADRYRWFDKEPTGPSAVAQTAIYMMDAVTALANRIIRWLDKP